MFLFVEKREELEEKDESRTLKLLKKERRKSIVSATSSEERAHLSGSCPLPYAAGSSGTVCIARPLVVCPPLRVSC